jgi:hypothetical protein
MGAWHVTASYSNANNIPNSNSARSFICRMEVHWLRMRFVPAARCASSLVTHGAPVESHDVSDFSTVFFISRLSFFLPRSLVDHRVEFFIILRFRIDGPLLHLTGTEKAIDN